LFGFLPQVLEHVRFMQHTGGLTYTESQAESQDMAQKASSQREYTTMMPF